MLEKYKIRATKKMLLLSAGALWSIAGERIITLGYRDLILNSQNPWGYLFISLIIFYIFLMFIFRKIVKKHTTRIMSSSLSDHCIFSFFDLKSYGIMILMIVSGITLRNSQIIDPLYLGTFYLGLGPALLSAAIMFLAAGFNFEKTKLNYLK